MPYQSTVESRIQLATTSSTSANLSSSLFVTTNQYFTNRMIPFTSFQEVKDNTAIPNTSNAYAALKLAFSQTGANVPIYLGRREADTMVLTPSPVVDNKLYGLVLNVTNTTLNSTVSTTVSVNAGGSASDESIATALYTAINAVTNITAVDSTGSVTVTADAGYTYTIESLSRVVDTYTTSETASTLLAALQGENNEDWYFLETEDHTETFILEMASEIEATDSSDFPKQYHVAIADADVLTALPDPALDTMGKLKELGYARTRTIWHQSSDTIFPEIAYSAYNGQFAAGSTTWKFMTGMSGVPAITNPATGIKASTALQGYIEERNGNWHAEERGVNFAHGGKMVGGEWCDVIRGKDWLTDQVETALLNLLLQQVGGKIPKTEKGEQLVKNTVDGVLKRAVDSGLLDGYVPTSIPSGTVFEDNAARILRNVKWVAYLAGAIHFIVIDGILTYKDAELA